MTQHELLIRLLDQEIDDLEQEIEAAICSNRPWKRLDGQQRVLFHAKEVLGGEPRHPKFRKTGPDTYALAPELALRPKSSVIPTEVFQRKLGAKRRDRAKPDGH